MVADENGTRLGGAKCEWSSNLQTTVAKCCKRSVATRSKIEFLDYSCIKSTFGRLNWHRMDEFKPYTVNMLRALARERDIDLRGLKKKVDICNRLREYARNNPEFDIFNDLDRRIVAQRREAEEQRQRWDNMIDDNRAFHDRLLQRAEQTREQREEHEVVKANCAETVTKISELLKISYERIMTTITRLENASPEEKKDLIEKLRKYTRINCEMNRRYFVLAQAVHPIGVPCEYPIAAINMKGDEKGDPNEICTDDISNMVKDGTNAEVDGTGAKV